MAEQKPPAGGGNSGNKAPSQSTSGSNTGGAVTGSHGTDPIRDPNDTVTGSGASERDPGDNPANRPPTDEEAEQEAAAGERAAELFGSRPSPNTAPMGLVSEPEVSKSDYEAQAKEATAAAEERDRRAAVKRGAPEEAMEDYHDNVVWLMDNRADDRVVLHERDPLHPMGEVLFGGGVPRRAYLTPRVQQLLQTGELMPVPEPRRTITIFDDDSNQEVEVPNPKYPDQNLPDPGVTWAAQPGRPVPLGRTIIDPDYFEKSELRAIRSRQAQLPTYVPLAAGGIQPPAVADENEEFMRGQRGTGQRSSRR